MLPFKCNFVVTFKGVEHRRDKSVHVSAYAIAAVNIFMDKNAQRLNEKLQKALSKTFTR